MPVNAHTVTHPNTANKHRQWCGGGVTAAVCTNHIIGPVKQRNAQKLKRNYSLLLVGVVAVTVALVQANVIVAAAHSHSSSKTSGSVVMGIGPQGEIEFNSLDGDSELVTQIQASQAIEATTSRVTGSSNNYDKNDISNNGVMSSLPSSYTEFKGGEIIGERVLRRSESPFLVLDNIFVPRNSKLTIEAGVTLEFAPTTGIIVQGILVAVGQPMARITLTAQTHLTNKELSLKLTNSEERGARLVDGPTPLEGRLQIYHKGSWRAVCSNSRNWTLSDYGVLCRQLGYRGGRFWNWVERRAGYGPRLLYEQPKCNGSERTLTDCAWSTRQLGAGVCDYHNDIGIQCQAVFAQPTAHWLGLYFDNVQAVNSLDKDNTVYTAQSQSTLRYMDIVHAGAGSGYATNSALGSLGLPPVLEHVVISQSAHTGINVTRPSSGFVMRNVTVRRSNGIGIFVNSSQGLVQLEGCNVLDNEADGIKYVGHDLRADERSDRASIFDFCTLPTTSGQTYPIALSFTQKFYAASKECAKYFFTRSGYRITVHFEYFVLRNNETMTVEIFDGGSASDRLLFAWKARNYTRPQSVTSTREKLFIRLLGNQQEEVNAYLRLTTGDVSAYDLRVVDSTIEDNGGRGIAIDNIRSKLHVHRSTVSGNGYISGVHVTSGAGDVNITESNISFNHGDGVNITYYGGNRNISRSSIASNKGYGVAVWLNETTATDRIEYIAFNQTTVVEYTQLQSNVEIGVRHGNFCAPIWVNITGNHFNEGNADDIYIESCWRYTSTNNSNLQLQIGHNLFENSRRNAIYMSPALNLRSRIEYNQFRFGQRGAIFIRNDFIFEEFNFFSVHIVIQSNYFMRNQGLYVVSLGLSPFSRRDVQLLLFTRNFVKENRITESFGELIDGGNSQEGASRLNPRSRVAAAVVVASSSVDIYRNILHNHDSAYEIGSQLNDQSQIINATYNWLGSADENKIFSRLFHRNDRYNLAKIEYIPYLLHNSNPGATAIIAISTLVPRFFHEHSESIGGEVDGQETIPAGVYTVTKDINIRPGGKLTIQAGVTLKFEPSVGMMVAGKLEARGRHPDDIFLTLRRETIVGGAEGGDNSTVMHDSDNLDMDAIDIETEPIIVESEDTPPKVPVRLMGGAGSFEGRLQIYLDGRWGTVCDYGWNEVNAALVCHHLGYTLNPQDWRLLRSQMPSVGITEDVIASNIRCTEHDQDITKCRAEHLSRAEFENSCTHENDVGVRCYKGAWAGVRFSMLSERTDLQYVTIEKAGLFDYATNALKPAIQMDFARHNLEHVRVIDNLNDGLGVIYSDIYAGKSVNNVKDSEFSNNHGNGISLKQLDLRIQGSVIKGNSGSGISHDPVISAVDQRELGGWFRMSSDFNTFETNYEPFLLPREEGNIDIGTWDTKYIRTEEHRGEAITRKLEIHCPAGYVLGIQLLNPIQTHSTESIIIYDSQTPNTRSDVWDVSRDLNVFPTTSSSYGIMVRYESGENALGGAVLLLSTVAAPVQNIRNKVVRGPSPSLHIRNTKIQNNFRGISAFYYNRYYGSQGEYYLRKANESIKIMLSEISHNEREAMLIKAPFWDVINSNLSEVTLHVNKSMITSNGHGIRQVSKDLRSSNNLFHYVVQDTTVENNANGGFDIQLPYVWQYNQNFTHTVFFGNSTWQRNRNFYINVRGHYAVFNISSNIFIDNRCARGLISLGGMEKCLLFDYNRIENNNARFIMEFKANSLSEIIGQVPALVAFNTIKGNRFESTGNSNYRTHAPMRQPKGHAFYTENRIPTAVIRLDGVQTVRLYRNLIAENEMEFNLVAGVRSACVNNYFYATENWWGTKDAKEIESKIFDFDNWNDHADVLYQPYLIEDSIDGSMSLVSQHDDRIDLATWSGGRIYKDVMLKSRSAPYIIRNDITIMPGVTLTVQHGVQLEFESNVGILVLGTLTAIGYRESPIIMRPYNNASREPLTFMRHRRSMEHVDQMQSYDYIRLCTNSQNCTGDSGLYNSVIKEGFLEYFNHTTLQWVPICDRRFTERNAQVVCRELGYDPLNVYYGHDRRIEFHTNSLTRIWSWVQPLECRGDEDHMEDCAERLNGQLYGHRHECRWDDAFVFVSCLSEPDDQVYWGGIRFANSEFEESQFQNRFHDANTHGLVQSKRSQLEFVHIENAGILHNQKSAALQAVYKNPMISGVRIVNSAHHGVNMIAPTGTINLNFLNISNAFGTGISILSLTGEGHEDAESSYVPLKSLDMPYKLFSMVDMCDPQKVLTVEERILVYYKYDNKPVNCVKIFTAAYKAKPIGFRLLQSNLFNHSKEYGRSDIIKLFDGDIYNVTSQFMGSIESDSSNQRSFFRSKSPTLSLQLIASGAPEHHGFIAEVVTVPISTIGQYRDALHNITYSHISGCIKGAVTYSSAGEITPTLTLTTNRIEGNCRQLYGNFSTCPSAMNLDVQNMHSLFFMNNLVMKNQGGLRLRADSRGSATSLRGFIHHNLFVYNRNLPALFAEGLQSSPYQEIELYRNYFAQNKAGYEDVIRLRQVVSNFSYNYVHSNVGGRILEISGFEKVRLPIYQSTSHNGFYRNIATNWMGRATIVAGTAGQQYVDNIFENPDNDYEMITVNNSIFTIDFWNSTIELWRSKIDARHNYWSYNNTISVQSRIRDKSDNPILLEVESVPFQMNNLTILDGKCPPGWNLVQDTCFIYVGASMTFEEAREFCRSENSSMPFIRTDSNTLWIYLQSQMQHLKYPEKVWVQDFNFIDRCTTFQFGATEFEDCQKQYGFICEIDPKVAIDPLSWRADVFAISIISALVLAIILLMLVGFCWYAKSKHRQVQRLQRRNSIRQSLRSLNSIDPQGSLRRRNFNISSSSGTLTKNITQDYKKIMMMDKGDGSIDSINKSVLSSDGSFEAYDQQTEPQQNVYPHSASHPYNEYVNHMALKPPPMETHKVATIGSAAKAKSSRMKAIPAAFTYEQQQHPDSFELSYRNEGFRDNSTFSGTRNNSISTSVAEDTPIIHHTDVEDGSDYYGNASTLPLRNERDENLSFFSDLKKSGAQFGYSVPKGQQTHSSFLPKHSNASRNDSTLPYEQKIDQINFSPMPAATNSQNESLYRTDNSPADMRRPDSYYTAVRSSKAQPQAKYVPSTLPTKQEMPNSPSNKNHSKRPKTVYQTANDERAIPSSAATRNSNIYHRSKSEALLETDFDTDPGLANTLQPSNRSYSQPLETAM